MTTTRKRAAAKKEAQFDNRYDAAGQGRRVRSWNPQSTGPQKVLQGYERIRNRARDVTRNDWAGESGVQKWTTALVGVGIQPRWKDKTLNEEWKAHATKQCDADGVLDAAGLQALGVRSWATSGEAFLRRRWRDPSLVDRGILAAPVQYQLIESDFVPMIDETMRIGMPNSNEIRQGIERNVYGRRIAYWMYPEHPGDGGSIVTSRTDLIRVMAQDVAHVFEPMRPGQLRGVSPLATILLRLRNSADFEDAVLDRQKLANLFVAFLKRTIPAGAQIQYDPLTGLPTFYDKKGNPLAGLEPGIFQELMPGEEVQFANPPEAGTGFPDYMRTTHRGTAAGMGLPYELFSGDLQDVSDRTLRVVINEFRRYCEQRQWHLVVPNLCQPMVDWWAESRALVDWDAARVKEVKSTCTWHTHGWEYIHPVQDVEGKVKAIEAGLSSRTAEISKRGDDPEEVDRQRAEDQQREKTLKIEKPVTPGQAGAGAPKEPVEPAKAQQIDDAFWTRIGDMQRAAFVDFMRAQEKPPAAPQGITPEQVAQIAAVAATAVVQPAMAQMSEMFAKALEAVSTVAQRPATPVEVKAEITTPEPKVTVHNEQHTHVEPTPVQVTNNVPPAEVTAKVEWPDRQRETTHEYDDKGEIVKSTTIETTLQ